MSPITIGVAGGSGSGKTTVARRVLERVGFERIAYVPQDAYYVDLAGAPPEKHAAFNFDHPDAFDNDLLIAQLRELQAGRPIEMPVYDFKTDSRKAETLHVDPQPVILLEGILIFADARLRALMDVKIYVDTDADMRFIRRLQRDITERGRSPQSVINQYLATVRPMHLEFVEPSKRYADVIIPEGGFNEVAIEMVAARLRDLLRREQQSARAGDR
jgi:uridine kinase